MRKGFLLIFCALVISTILGQVTDSLVEKKSAQLSLAFKPKSEFSGISMTLFKFKTGRFGIQMIFEKLITAGTGSFSMSLENFAFTMESKNELLLKGPNIDNTDFKNGKAYFLTTRILESDEFDLLRKEKVIQIIINYNNSKKAIKIKEDSQTEIFQAAQLF